jgi:2'-5' RNA ligase
LTQPGPVVGRPRETALSVVVPEAEGPTLDFRRRFLERTVARKIPPHVTILYPFVDADAVDAALLDELRRLYASTGQFAFELAHFGTFAAHLWLAPEPRARFVDLIELTCARFPDCAPYGGAFAESAAEPHLTIGEGLDVDALRTSADRIVGPALPVPCRAGSVTLLEEQTDGTWSERAAFPLGGP